MAKKYKTSTGLNIQQASNWNGITANNTITNSTYVPSQLNNVNGWINTYQYSNYFKKLAEAFELPITEEQSKMLDELMNTGDESNKTIACATFKYLINNKETNDIPRD